MIWHDIWPTICADNWEEMKLLRKRYRKYLDGWQGCWVEEEVKGLGRRGF